jgi:transposase InsO family protein
MAVETPQNAAVAVRQVYERGAAAFSNAAPVYREAKQMVPRLTQREVDEQLQTFPSYTRHRRVSRRFVTGKVISGGFMETLQADLMDVSRYSRWNNGFKFILVVLDVFSKRAFVQPLKRKSATPKAFKLMLPDFPQQPLYLHVDRGTEFYNAEMRQLLQENAITMYSTHSVYKANMAERLIRTLRKRLARYFEHYGTWRWIDYLQPMINNYNNTVHSATKLKPTSVGLHNQKELWQKLYMTDVPDAGPVKFKPGEFVRISKSRTAFTKEAYDMYSEEVYAVTRVCPGPPIYYRIADMTGEVIEGRFYNNELTKTVRPERFVIEKVLRRNIIKDGVRHHFVSWRGYPASFNCYVKASDVINIR